MGKRLFGSLIVAFAGLAAAPAVGAGLTPIAHIEPAGMMGRWYEVARLPTHTQQNCHAGASDWTRTADGFSVIQTCHRGGPDGPLAEWKATARIVDPASNARFRMSFLGGLISQEYWVLDNRPDQGWLILATPNGKFLWLMSQKPVLSPAAKAQAIARIKQLGFDTGRLVFPLPPHS